jgi:hypothetical protein
MLVSAAAYITGRRRSSSNASPRVRKRDEREARHGEDPDRNPERDPAGRRGRKGLARDDEEPGRENSDRVADETPCSSKSISVPLS